MESLKPIKSATIQMSHSTFEDGTVTWACDVTGTTPKFHAQFSDIELSGLIGCKSFYIIAHMSSTGMQDNSWQHTQLFRTELGGNDTPFYLELTF